jgi:hypothetical protein
VEYGEKGKDKEVIMNNSVVDGELGVTQDYDDSVTEG